MPDVMEKFAPPQNREAEIAVLGSMLAEKESMLKALDVLARFDRAAMQDGLHPGANRGEIRHRAKRLGNGQSGGSLRWWQRSRGALQPVRKLPRLP